VGYSYSVAQAHAVGRRRASWKAAAVAVVATSAPIAASNQKWLPVTTITKKIVGGYIAHRTLAQRWRTSCTPAKAITISAKNVAISSGATLDLRGGGDLFAYRFVSGNGGTKDILASTSSFAIIPGYQANYAPFGAFNSLADLNSSTNQLGGDPGYANNKLHVGDKIYLQASNGLSAGYYTLLPARYALMPGALLVTPKSGVPTGTVLQPDGSSIVSGYRYSTTQTGQPLMSRFEVDPAAVINSRAEYDLVSADHDLSHKANRPSDSGKLVLAATQSMSAGCIPCKPGSPA